MKVSQQIFKTNHNLYKAGQVGWKGWWPDSTSISLLLQHDHLKRWTSIDQADSPDQQDICRYGKWNRLGPVKEQQGRG